LTSPADKPLSPAEERLLAAFRQGIRPDEGAEAFARATACRAGAGDRLVADAARC
jgi:hypothetical protein